MTEQTDYLNAHEASWVLTTDGDGDGIQIPAVKALGTAVQAEGTWGSGTLTIEGSNDGTNFHALTTLDGTAAPTLTADGMIEISTGAKWIRPSFAGGAAGSITVTLYARG